MPATDTIGYTPEQARVGATYIHDMLGDRNRNGKSLEQIEAFLLKGGGLLRLNVDRGGECLVLLPKPFQGKRIHFGKINVDLPACGDPAPAEVPGSHWAPQSLGDDIIYVSGRGTLILYSRLRPDGKYDSTFAELKDDLGADEHISRAALAAA